jgi:uncharacterized DUF497 family protein
MQFEWHEPKRLANVEKHGLDFVDAVLLFDAPRLVAPANFAGNEQFSIAIGMIEDVYVTAIFTRRGSAIRLISMRRARRNERKRYQAVFGP